MRPPSSSDRQYPDFEQTMRAETMDVIQVDYALDNRNAAQGRMPDAAMRARMEQFIDAL